MDRNFKHIKPPPSDLLTESRRPIQAQIVSKTTKDIKVFKSNTNFNVPIDDSNHISIKPGTPLICFENDVFLKQDGHYVKAQFDTKFLELNKKIFEKTDL